MAIASPRAPVHDCADAMTAPSSKASQLRACIDRATPAFLLEAHNAVAAKIVENAKFDAIWASGLTLSSVLGKRDANEASWSEIAGAASSINDVVDIPVLVDGDSGYGNFNSVRQFVRRTRLIGMAGVVLEDKQFPKLNSLLETRDTLLPAKHFCGLIRAAKDSQADGSFSVIA